MLQFLLLLKPYLLPWALVALHTGPGNITSKLQAPPAFLQQSPLNHFRVDDTTVLNVSEVFCLKLLALQGELNTYDMGYNGYSFFPSTKVGLKHNFEESQLTVDTVMEERVYTVTSGDGASDEVSVMEPVVYPAYKVGGKFFPFTVDTTIKQRTDYGIFQSLQSYAGAYIFSMGGNYDAALVYGKDYPQAKKFIIGALAQDTTAKSMWQWLSGDGSAAGSLLGYIWSKLDTRHKGVVISVWDYVHNYFGSNYDVKAAEAWYKQDVTTRKFASTDYSGNHPAARKATAFIERLIFKHHAMDINRVRKWLDALDGYFKNKLEPNYAQTAKYWANAKEPAPVPSVIIHTK